MSGVPVFDRASYATMVTELGEDGVRELVVIFLDETDRRVALLQQLSGETDRVASGARRTQLKSDAAALGLAERWPSSPPGSSAGRRA